MWRLVGVGLVGLALSILSSCKAPATQVLVFVDIDGTMMLSRTRSIRVRVYDQDGAATLDEARDLAAPSLPLSVSLVPIDGDAARRYRVEVALVDASDAEFAVKVAEGAFVRDELREIWLRFEDSCLGVSCGFGRTCIDGTCERACFEPSVPGSVTTSVPGACPCECDCPGDECQTDGLCRPTRPSSRVDAGFAHACVIDPDGRLYCFGDNSRGQLGLGDRDARARPTEVALRGPATHVTGGEAHTCAILSDGTLECWGANDQGQLGTPPGDDILRPERVATSLGSFIHVDAGVAHTCAGHEGGSLECWGRNADGQLGVGTAGDPLPPTEVAASGSALGGFTEVFSGASHTCALQGSASRLWCWGINSNGVLGRALPHDSTTPMPTPEAISFPAGFRSAATGGWHVAAIGGDGGVYVWGDEANGRLGLDLEDFTGVIEPTFLMEGAAVAAGLRRTCVTQEDESVWCFGTNGSGELGVGSEELSAGVPVQMREDRWDVLSLGAAFTCGIRRGGALFCWGDNTSGQLGIGSEDVPLTRTPRRVCMP